MVASGDEVRARGTDEAWSQRAEVAIAAVSAYLADETERGEPAERAPAPANRSRLAPAFFAAYLVVECAWVLLLVYLLHVSGLLE